MTQPQQPFGEARACTAVADPCAYCGRPIGDIGAVRIAGQRFHWQCTQPPAQPMPWAHPAPMRETAEPVDAAELLKRQAAQIGALQVRVGVQDARIAALDDDCRRLRAEVERLGQAQAI